MRKLLCIVSPLLVLAIGADTTDVFVPPRLPTRQLVRDAYGYSLEPVWTADYISSPLTYKLMNIIANVTGKPPTIRVGGTTADQTFLHPDQSIPAAIYPNTSATDTFNISRTDFIYTLNFKDNSSHWSNAAKEAAAVHEALGSKLKLFELGNEVDHYINKDWRPAGWGVAEYVEQWRSLSDQIVASEWYRGAAHGPKFQAAVFADPPEVPDQQDEVDDFDIVNLTRRGLTERDKISTYAVHLYPQSTCDAERWGRLSLNLLSNHSVLWQNVSQYIPQVAAADAVDIPLVFGETNSASCSGRNGISDTFGAALWSVDYVLLAASIGMPKVYFHLGAQSEYSSFVPLPFQYKNESLQAGIRSLYYGHYFLSHVLAAEDEQHIAQLPQANASDFSGYAIYSPSRRRRHATLQKLVFIDLGVWNSTSGLSNPSTLGTTDSTSHSTGSRPVRRVVLTTPWPEGTRLEITRLRAPGTNAKSDITISGQYFTPEGDVKGRVGKEFAEVGNEGTVAFEMDTAEAILISAAGAPGTEGRARDEARQLHARV